jgi:hypothetical protein
MADTYQGTVVKYYVCFSGNTIPHVRSKAESFLVQVASKYF